MRSLLYWLVRLPGDVDAVRRGTLGERITRRAAGPVVALLAVGLGLGLPYTAGAEATQNLTGEWSYRVWDMRLHAMPEGATCTVSSSLMTLLHENNQLTGRISGGLLRCDHEPGEDAFNMSVEQGDVRDDGNVYFTSGMLFQHGELNGNRMTGTLYFIDPDNPSSVDDALGQGKWVASRIR